MSSDSTRSPAPSCTRLLLPFLNDRYALQWLQTCRTCYALIDSYRFKRAFNFSSLPQRGMFGIVKDFSPDAYDRSALTRQFDGASLIIRDRFNSPLTANRLPERVRAIQFGLYFNQPLKARVLPDSLSELHLGQSFNRSVDPGVLPESLRKLEFGDEFNTPLRIGSLPPRLEKLEFGDRFNWEIPVGVLPASLKSLRFGYQFNQTLAIGALPRGLEYLQFGFNYTEPIEPGIFPSSLKSLILTGLWNHPLEPNALHDGLVELYLIGNFGHPIPPLVLPPSLKRLELGRNFHHRLELGSLPRQLEILKLPLNYSQPIESGVLPSSLQEFEIRCEYHQPFPAGPWPSLKRLKIVAAGEFESSWTDSMFARSFEESLKHSQLEELTCFLSMDSAAAAAGPVPVGFFPFSLRKLWYFCCEQPECFVIGSLPPDLRELKLNSGCKFTQTLREGMLPSSLKILRFQDGISVQLPVLPPSLEVLELSKESPLPLEFPLSLRQLKLGSTYLLSDSFHDFACA